MDTHGLEAGSVNLANKIGGQIANAKGLSAIGQSALEETTGKES